MKYIIHRNIRIPLIGFGTWMLGEDEKKEKEEIETLLRGINEYDMTLIDTAEMYGYGKAEALIGKLLKKVDRKKIYIIDKILPENAINGRYLESCKASLKRLGVDYIDLYLLHWNEYGLDLGEMIQNMENLKMLGLIKNWGVSNFDTHEMEELFSYPDGDKCFLNQCLYNLERRQCEYDLLDWCKRHDVLFMAYSPLLNNKDDKNKLLNSEAFNFALKLSSRSLESLLLSFVIRKEDVITAFKTSNVTHLKSNLENVFAPIPKETLTILDKEFPSPKEKEYIKYI